MSHGHPAMGLCRFIQVGRERIHVLEAGTGPAVVLVHGGQAWGYAWRHQLTPLAAAGFRAMAPDLPGSGYSDLPADYDYSVRGLSNFLGTLLDALGFSQAAFVANSAGGLPVLDFAIRHPERVTALVLASSCGVSHREPLLWNLVRWPGLGEGMRLFLSPRLVADNLGQMVYDKTLITDEVVSAYYEPLCRPGAWRAMLRLERSWRPGWVEANLERIAAPTLIIWGNNDPYHPLTMAQEFGRRLPEAQVITLPACGHLPQEEHPEEFSRLGVEFLGRYRLPHLTGRRRESGLPALAI